MTSARRPIVALVPVRSPGEGKTRLSDELGVPERAALTSAMLADVAAALRASSVDRVVVAAAGGAAARAAAALGLDVTMDPPSNRSLDDALYAAQPRLGVVGSLLVVMADLPRLRAEDVDALLSTDAQVVVAPSDDGGTAGLLRQPPSVIATAYGPSSSSRHLRLGHAARVATASVDLEGFRQDVDTVADLKRLDDGHLGSATRSVLDRLLERLPDVG